MRKTMPVSKKTHPEIVTQGDKYKNILFILGLLIFL